jgi:hypothetical protein
VRDEALSLELLFSDPDPAPVPDRVAAAPSPQPEGRAHPCTRCSRFAYATPTVCYWCRRLTVSANMRELPANMLRAT